jgi:AcrR family transcriptional regulator
MPADDTATRILDAAGPIFADKGFERATVRDICQAAGVNLASVNYYFRDKERLYIEAVKQAAMLRQSQVPMPQWSAGTPPAEKLRQFVRTMLARMLGAEQAPWQARLMMREVFQPTSACRELAEEYFRPHFDLLLSIVAELTPPEMPFHQRRRIADSVIGQCLHYRLAGGVLRLLVPADELAAHYQPEQLAEHIAAFSLAALGASPALGDRADVSR